MTGLAPEIVDEIAVRLELVNACALLGGQSEFAKLHNLPPQNISNIIHGLRSPGLKIARLLGFERIIRYRKSVPDNRSGHHVLPAANSGDQIPVFSSS